MCDYAIKQVMLLPWCVYALVCGGDFLKNIDDFLLNFGENGLWDKKHLIRFWVDSDQEICHCDIALDICSGISH